jgi:glycosyltransferase involved in cell wall biosynthesis
MRVLFDLRGTQSAAYRDRGIARFLTEQATALERVAPGSVDRYVVDAADAVPTALRELDGAGRLVDARAIDGPTGLYHVGSPFEAGPLDRVLPTAVRDRGWRIAVTLYEGILAGFSSRSLADAMTAGSYESRLNLIRAADLVLATSAATARDAVEHFGIPSTRIAVIGCGVEFTPTADRPAALAAARQAVPGLEDHFVLSTGWSDQRKNVAGLIRAYAALPSEQRDAHQLVIVCGVEPGERDALESLARDRGAAGRVLLTGFVPDATLIDLHRTCDLFCVPLTNDGDASPIAAALACGVSVLGDDAASPHVRAVRFDPTCEVSITGALTRALADDGLRQSLACPLPLDKYWNAVAALTAAAYGTVRPPRSRRIRRRRLAFVTPLPPALSGVAGYATRLLGEFAARRDVTLIAPTPHAREIDDHTVVPIRAAGVAEALADGFDEVLYAMGNSSFHAEILRLLRIRPGVVMAHDVRLSALYDWLDQHRPELRTGTYPELLERLYDGRCPRAAGLPEHRGPADLDRYGVYLAREAIGLSGAFLVHSEQAAAIARDEAPAGQESKVVVVPFAADPRAAAVRRANVDRDLVVSLGVVGPAKRPDAVVEAFALAQALRPSLRLVLAGPVEPDQALALTALADELGVAGSATIAGSVSDTEWWHLVETAAVAVQLRATTNGEQSDTVTTCLAAGLPVISTGGEAGAHHVGHDAPPSVIGDLLGSLLRRGAGVAHPGRRLALDVSPAQVVEAVLRCS